MRVRNRRRPVALVAALALTGCVLAVGCTAPDADTSADNPAGVTISSEGSDSGFHGTWLDQPYEKPAMTFVDTQGATFDMSTDMDKPVTLVFFGYTNCPDICNAVLADAASALRRIDPGVRDDVELVFVTTDPARDTPPVIREYLDRFDESFVGLTAELPVIERAAEQLGVGLAGTEQMPSGGYAVGHGTQLIGFGPDGRAHLVWTHGTPVGELRDDIATLAASR